MRIFHNVPALISYNAVNQTTGSLTKAIEKLSTGLRINSAADDAAGLAISEKMRAQIRGLDMAVRNAQDGISMIQTGEGALNETHSILQRMRELAVQASNDTLTQQDRSYIQLEINQLRDEVDRISNTTQFNKKKLLNGSAAVLWSTDNLETRVLVRGGLRQVDRFGQKNAVEGNYKLEISATPGEAEVKKSDIFKIKHKNVVMNVSTNPAMGIEEAGVKVDNLPAGYWNAVGANDEAVLATGGMTLQQQYGFGPAFSTLFDPATMGSAVAGVPGDAITPAVPAEMGISASASMNASVMFEVVAVTTASVTFRATSNVLWGDGSTKTYVSENIVLGTAGLGAAETSLGFTMGTGTMVFNGDSILDPANTAGLSIGDKMVFGVTWQVEEATAAVAFSGIQNPDWPLHWRGTAAGEGMGQTFNFDASSLSGLAGNDVHFKQFFLNTANGLVYDSDIVLSVTSAITGLLAQTSVTVATFEAAYVGQVAQGDVRLRDLDKFWDPNGRFMLEDSQIINITQGDGRQTSITLNSMDTLDDVRQKINDAIAYDLGQAQYANQYADNFVTFVEEASGSIESVEGTFIVRSLIAGEAGRLSFSGDEDVINAFSLNVIQEATENQFRATVTDAHSGATVASSVKVTGNRLYGAIHPNIDVIFDPMANINVGWAGQTFTLSRDTTKLYSTVIHLTDNTTVFQVGANQGEDIGIDIGDMGSMALGLNRVVVSDRDMAARSLSMIDDAISRVSKQRAMLGAYQNRLEHTVNNLTTASTNTSAAESRIRDVDMAKEMMNFTRLNILLQSGNAMLAQANQLPQNVLSLLRG